jgi:nucleoid-associated protein YgaU
MALSSVFKSRGPVGRSLLATAAAALILTAGLGLPGGAPSAQSGGIDRSVIPIAADAPERYVVQPGDTLWDI